MAKMELEIINLILAPPQISENNIAGVKLTNCNGFCLIYSLHKVHVGQT